MHKSLTLEPTGRLRVVEDPAGDAFAAEDEIGSDLADAFAESNAAGLLVLVQPQPGSAVSPTLAFWRDFARQFFRALCQLGEAAVDQWKTVAPPGELELRD